MILTLTMNPAVDQTLWVDQLSPGTIHRPREVHLDPAGKGINVSRMAHRLGAPSLALGFIAGDVGRIVRKALDQEHVHHHFIDVDGQTRINVTVQAADGTATSFYAPGPQVPADAQARLDEILEVWFDATRVLVLAGSILPGVDAGVYARYIERARARGCKVILDADGECFRLGLAAKPWLIKPNVEEASRLLGRALPDLSSVVAGARELKARGVETVVVSMGGEGLVCVCEEGAWRAHPVPIKRLSTVGSGDSLVAGIAVSVVRGQSLAEGLKVGTAAGAATAMTPGTTLGSAEEIARLLPQVQIESL